MQTNKLFSIAATGAMALLAACSADPSDIVIVDPPMLNGMAMLTVVFPSHPADTLKVLVSDSSTIAKAKAFVQTGNGPRMLTGKIVRGSGLDTKYPFHYLPESVALADVGIEICDGAPMRTAKDVDDFFTWSTGNVASAQATWCPWESKPIAVTQLTIP